MQLPAEFEAWGLPSEVLADGRTRADAVLEWAREDGRTVEERDAVRRYCLLWAEGPRLGWWLEEVVRDEEGRQAMRRRILRGEMPALRVGRRWEVAGVG